MLIQQARKSSEDTQVAGYARFEKVWAGEKNHFPRPAEIVRILNILA